ncbi:uncharacterized protein CANTADRAFT_33263, partial [Suhomyces tanzawaensis NRRL Y-17324]
IRNVISLRTRNVSQRIQRALQELSEALAEHPQQAHSPVPVPVRVPARNGQNARGLRRYSTSGARSFGTFTTGGSAGTSWSFNHFTNANSYKSNFFAKIKLFAKFYHPRPADTRQLFRGLNHGFMFHNFSQAHQNTFRMKLHMSKLSFSYRPLLNHLKDKYHGFDRKQDEPANKRFAPFLAKQKNPGLRLNLSLTANHHQLTMKLARTDSSATTQEKHECNQVVEGSYIEFPITFNLNIPHETLLSEEVLDEMLYSVKAFEQKLREFKQDIANLFELGELPIKYIAHKNVLRVYFPNCDSVKLESLCREKNITGGVIYSDYDDETTLPEIAAAAPLTPVDQNDIISSYFGLGSSGSSDSETQDPDDLLSELLVFPLANEEIVRIEVAGPQVSF